MNKQYTHYKYKHIQRIHKDTHTHFFLNTVLFISKNTNQGTTTLRNARVNQGLSKLFYMIEIWGKQQGFNKDPYPISMIVDVLKHRTPLGTKLWKNSESLKTAKFV